MQCKSDPALHYWKSPSNLPAYLSSRVKALNPTTESPNVGIRLNIEYDDSESKLTFL
jgi:hypothetical protein